MANSKSRPSSDLLNHLQSRLSQHVEPGLHLSVALSGGIDSTVLLHTLVVSQSVLKPASITAVHVHHGLSPNADAWESFCRQYCAQLGVTFRSQRVEVKAEGEGIEAGARRARYAALEGSDCDWILLGHHRDDQAETVLLNLLRGAGVHGAAGMCEVRGKLLRPLLGVSRQQVMTYAIQNSIPWIEDESNADSRYRRNFLRHQVMPLLEQPFPQAAASLVRAADAFRDAAELLDEVAQNDLGDVGFLTVPMLAALSIPRATNLLAYYLRQQGIQIPASAMLKELLRQLVVAGGDSEICFTVGDRQVRCFQQRVLVDAVAEPVSPVAWDGEATAISWGAHQLHVCPAHGQGIDASLLRSAPLQFSPRRGGELLQIRQDGPRRPLKDLLREAAIPPWRRKNLPALYAGEELVWMAGIGIAAKYRCKPDAAGFLIEFDGVTW
jgi:tRNA(Ile)-lysidine synthase